MNPARGLYRARTALAVVAIALVSGTSGCSRETQTAPPAPAPSAIRHLVLISVDTLRADFLGAYGRPWDGTPNMDRLAREGVLFEQAFSAAPTTVASHGALFTGKYPDRHGAPHNGTILRPENRTLAEVLAGAGFQTAGVIGGYPLARRFGFAQGFAHYEGPLPHGRAVTDAALAWFDEVQPERGFLFVHYWDVHWPYQPPPPYDRRYRDDELPLTGSMEDLKAVREALRTGAPGSLDESRALEGAYAGGVAWTDHQIGRLLEGLEARGILDRALVVLTSDHGESIHEHDDYWNHGPTVYDSATHIPLVLRPPGGRTEALRIPLTVSNVDVFPTLLAALRIEAPVPVEGRDLTPLLGGGSLSPEPVFSRATKPKWADRKCRGVWTERWKLMECPSRGRLELYDRLEDPEEARDLLAGDDPGLDAEARALIELMNAWRDRGNAGPPIEDLSPEVKEQLEALGYAG